MLDGMRKAAKGGIGRIVMVIVMGLIIVSFVIWGVGDMLRGMVSDKVATVGSAVITASEFQRDYQNMLYRFQAARKTALTNAQARALGFDRQVLGQLIDDAALDQRARALGLGLSYATIADAARSDPNLKDASGKFNRALFDQLVRDSGLTEAGFFAEQRATYLRQQLEYTLVDGLKAPEPLVAMLAAAGAQSRDIDYVTLPKSAAGDIPAPSAEALNSYYEERKDNYRAPEYRALDILLVDPSTLAKPDAVSDEDASAVYEKTKSELYTTSEKRDIQQMVFATEAEAAAARARLAAGEDFDALAKERKLSPADLELGLIDKAKADALDPAIGNAAFALKGGEVSDVVQGKFGFLLLSVTRIDPAGVKTFDQVKEEVKKQIAAERAANDVQSVHDKLEDLRVSGKTIPEAAKALGLETQYISAVDASGRDPNGAPVKLPEERALLSAAFASDIGVDDAALNTHDGGYLWFDVAKVDPAHQRTFDEVKAEVETAWREGEVEKALAAKAADLVKQLDGGGAFADLAKEMSLELKSAKDIKRGAPGVLTANVAVAVFAGPADKGGSAEVSDGRVVFAITKDFTPPFDPSAPGVKSAADKLSEGLQTSMIIEYIEALKAELGVTIHPSTLQMAEGS